MMLENLSKRAQKFYRNNPEAYLELKEIQQRGTRICRVCKTEIQLDQNICPVCGLILRKSSFHGIWKWILASTLLVCFSGGAFILFIFGQVPACDAPKSLTLLKAEFDHSLYATTLNLTSSEALAYGPEKQSLFFQDRFCRGMIKTHGGTEIHLEYTLEHQSSGLPNLTFKITSEP